jgi:hypothetical protein
MIRPSRPKPWLEYFSRSAGSIAAGRASSSCSSASSRNGLRSCQYSHDGPSRSTPAVCDSSWASVAAAISGLEASDVGAGVVVELQPALLAQLHDRRRREALRVRGDPVPMPRRQRLAGIEISVAERSLPRQLALPCHRHGAAGLLGDAHLIAEPVGDVGESGREPVGSVGHARGMAEAPPPAKPYSRLTLPSATWVNGAVPTAARCSSTHGISSGTARRTGWTWNSIGKARRGRSEALGAV